MEEIVVTRLWMGGVMAVMLVFAIIALYGYFKQTHTHGSENNDE